MGVEKDRHDTLAAFSLDPWRRMAEDVEGPEKVEGTK